MAERTHLDFANKRFRRWVDEQLVEDRDAYPDEVEFINGATAQTNRETNRTTLLDRLAGNRTGLVTIVRATSFTSAQRDDALRLLARNAYAQNKVIEAMAGRLAALDTTD